MTKAYICSIGSYTNIRSGPGTNYVVSRRIDLAGTLTDYIESAQDSSGYTWHRYQLGWIREDVVTMALLDPASVKRDVPYKNQNAAGATLSRNDCGPASLAMLVEYYADLTVTVDEVGKAAGQVGHNFTNFYQLDAAAKHYNLIPQYHRPASLAWIIQRVQVNTPVLMLVNYGEFHTGQDFGHFVVVIGYEYTEQDGLFIIYHDPNYLPHVEDQACVFVAAISNLAPTGNTYGYQGMTAQLSEEARWRRNIEARVAAIEQKLQS